MVALGVGKNMVRAIRFWVQAAGIARAAAGNRLEVTALGRALLARNGHDPFLEDIRTLWLIHWNISTLAQEPLFAWFYLLNHWRRSEFSRTEILRAFRQEAERVERKLSDVTLEQHFDVFLHTYVPTRSRKGEILEDNLDSPLVELSLIELLGERNVSADGRREPVYAFRRTAKPEITPELFTWCLSDYWDKYRGAERTLPFRDVAVSDGSPGLILKLPEADVREHLGAVGDSSGGYFRSEESAAQARVIRAEGEPRPTGWLPFTGQEESMLGQRLKVVTSKKESPALFASSIIQSSGA